MVFGIQKVSGFIRDELPQKLKRDLLKQKIMREADLECRAYYHLTRFLSRQPKWRIFARKSSPIERFIDLLLFKYPHRGAAKNPHPRIAIELKWNHAEITEKDRESLRLAIDKLGVERAYFITTLIGRRKFKRITKTPKENGKLIEICVPLPLTGEKLKRWKEQRKAFMKNMQPRKSKKAPTP